MNNSWAPMGRSVKATTPLYMRIATKPSLRRAKAWSAQLFVAIYGHMGVDPQQFEEQGKNMGQLSGGFAFSMSIYRGDYAVRVACDKGHGLSSGLVGGPA